LRHRNTSWIAREDVADTKDAPRFDRGSSADPYGKKRFGQQVETAGTPF
jgi:hypothetical protein